MTEQHHAPPVPSGYEPPPAFAPPSLRVAPLNETQVLGRTTYPGTPRPSWPPPGAGASPPITWAPAISWAPPMTWAPPTSSQPVDRAARRRRILSFVTVGAVVLALVAVVSALLSGPGAKHAKRSLTLPDSVDEYTRISTLSGAQLTGLFGGGGGFRSIPSSDLQAAKVAVYGEHDQGQPSLVFVGFTAEGSPSIGGQLHSRPAGAVTDDVLAGAGSTITPITVEAGPLGGAVKCANLRLDGQDASAGVWADNDTLGIVLIIDSTRTEHTSTVVRDFRAQAEH